MGRAKDFQAERRLDHFKAGAREAGVKLTHQRLEIFREIASSIEHPDAETVLRAVQQRVPTVSLDTVYRTLWMLRDLGLVTTLGARRENVRFDANLERHHHYVCVRCGLVRDFGSAALNALRVPAGVKEFGSVIGAHVEVRGLCARCAQERSEEPRGAQRPTRKTRGRSGHA
jgi:Fur family peroxide stress response transcriptional regulator